MSPPRDVHPQLDRFELSVEHLKEPARQDRQNRRSSFSLDERPTWFADQTPKVREKKSKSTVRSGVFTVEEEMVNDELEVGATCDRDRYSPRENSCSFDFFVRICESDGIVNQCSPQHTVLPSMSILSCAS